jgi:hypothetical protein
MSRSVSIQLADPKANYLAHKTEIDRAVSRAVESGFTKTPCVPPGIRARLP